MKFKKFLPGSSLLSLVFAGSVFAQTISLYDQPNDTGKVVGSADLSAGIIPIFSTKDSAWVKVADPRNGNVGWIKNSDLKNLKGTDLVTYQQQIITNGNQPNSIQVIQTRGANPPTRMSNEQAQAIVQKVRKEQQSIQDSMQGIMQNMNEVIQKQWNMWNAQGGFPIVIVPVPGGGYSVAPAGSVKTPAATTPAATQPAQQTQPVVQPVNPAPANNNTNKQ